MCLAPLVGIALPAQRLKVLQSVFAAQSSRNYVIDFEALILDGYPTEFASGVRSLQNLVADAPRNSAWRLSSVVVGICATPFEIPLDSFITQADEMRAFFGGE